MSLRDSFVLFFCYPALDSAKTAESCWAKFFADPLGSLPLRRAWWREIYCVGLRGCGSVQRNGGALRRCDYGEPCFIARRFPRDGAEGLPTVRFGFTLEANIARRIVARGCAISTK